MSNTAVPRYICEGPATGTLLLVAADQPLLFETGMATFNATDWRLVTRADAEQEELLDAPDNLSTPVHRDLLRRLDREAALDSEGSESPKWRCCQAHTQARRQRTKPISPLRDRALKQTDANSRSPQSTRP